MSPRPAAAAPRPPRGSGASTARARDELAGHPERMAWLPEGDRPAYSSSSVDDLRTTVTADIPDERAGRNGGPGEADPADVRAADAVCPDLRQGSCRSLFEPPLVDENRLNPSGPPRGLVREDAHQLGSRGVVDQPASRQAATSRRWWAWLSSHANRSPP